MPMSKLIFCAVEGCQEQYLQTTERAIRICATHRAADSFILAGGDSELSRFCQQCSRPHGLDRFRGPHRGCENRLRRRRLRVKNRRNLNQRRPREPTSEAHCDDDAEELHGEEVEDGQMDCDANQPIHSEQRAGAGADEDSRRQPPTARSSKSSLMEDILDVDDDAMPWADPSTQGGSMKRSSPLPTALQEAFFSGLGPSHQDPSPGSGHSGRSAPATFLSLPQHSSPVFDVLMSLEKGEVIPVVIGSTSFPEYVEERDTWWRRLAHANHRASPHSRVRAL